MRVVLATPPAWLNMAMTRQGLSEVDTVFQFLDALLTSAQSAFLSRWFHSLIRLLGVVNLESPKKPLAAWLGQFHCENP